MFPCKDCILRTNCSEICEEVEKRNRMACADLVNSNKCPDCGSKLNERDYATHVSSRGQMPITSYLVDCPFCEHQFMMVNNEFGGRIKKL